MKRIKLAQVITRLVRGGAQRMCLDLIENLEPAQYEITLISGVESGSEGSFKEEVQKKGINHVEIPLLVRNISPLRDILALIQLWRFFKKKSFDIVHLHTSKAGALGVLAARLAGVPKVVYSPHGHIFDRRTQLRDLPFSFLGFLFKINRRIYALSDKVIALTPEDKREQMALGLAQEKKFEVICNAVDLQRFDPGRYNRQKLRAKLGIANEERPVLLCVSRLSPEKGIKDLIEAMASLPKKQGPILFIAGDGPEAAVIRDKISDLKLTGYINCLGYRDDIPELMAAADVYILPSRYEAMGIVLAEAMAMKLPVVATRTGGVPSIVEHEINGLLVEPANPDLLAKAVDHLIQDKALRARLAQNGFEKARISFSIERMVNHFTKLYHDEK